MLDFDEARDDGVAVASAGPYANRLHLAPDGQPCQYLNIQFLQAGYPSSHPTSHVKPLNATHFILIASHIDSQTDKPYGHDASRRRSGKNSHCYN